VQALCFKIIFRLFLARSSIEDALVLLNIMQKHPELARKTDLRADIRALPALEGSSQVAGENNIDFTFNELSSMRLLENSHLGALPKNTDAFCADGKNLYHFSSSEGLFKISIRNESKMPGLVVHRNEGVKEWGEHARMLFFNNRIFVRSINDKSKLLHVVDPDTLEVDKEYPELKFAEDATNSLGKLVEEPDKDGRTLKQSPFFTDGTYFYVVSQKKEQTENEDESLFQLVVEVYNPANNFEFVRSFPLYKNQQKDLFMKESNNIDFIMNANWHTNGKYLAVRKGRKAWFFDTQSGVKIRSEKSPFDDEIVMIHNYLNDTVLICHGEKVCEGPLKNFKAYKAKESGDTHKSAAEVYAKYKDIYVGSAVAPKQLNVIQRIMRKKEGV